MNLREPVDAIVAFLKEEYCSGAPDHRRSLGFYASMSDNQLAAYFDVPVSLIQLARLQAGLC